MSTEVKNEVLDFEIKCRKLVVLLKNGVITETEYDNLKKKLIEEMRL